MLVTYVRIPTRGHAAVPARRLRPRLRADPADLRALLDAWARAGYVVAAPVFPLGNANAPGGPNETDIVNQPADMRLVITRLLALDTRPGGLLYGRIDPNRIAIAGHSDGAVTAFAVAYDRRYRDRRFARR